MKTSLLAFVSLLITAGVLAAGIYMVAKPVIDQISAALS